MRPGSGSFLVHRRDAALSLDCSLARQRAPQSGALPRFRADRRAGSQPVTNKPPGLLPAAAADFPLFAHETAFPGYMIGSFINGRSLCQTNQIADSFSRPPQRLPSWAAPEGLRRVQRTTAAASILDKLGMQPVINGVGTVTVLGGSLMPPKSSRPWSRRANTSFNFRSCRRRSGNVSPSCSRFQRPWFPAEQLGHHGSHSCLRSRRRSSQAPAAPGHLGAEE